MGRIPVSGSAANKPLTILFVFQPQVLYAAEEDEVSRRSGYVLTGDLIGNEIKPIRYPAFY